MWPMIIIKHLLNSKLCYEISKGNRKLFKSFSPAKANSSFPKPRPEVCLHGSVVFHFDFQMKGHFVQNDTLKAVWNIDLLMVYVNESGECSKVDIVFNSLATTKQPTPLCMFSLMHIVFENVFAAKKMDSNCVSLGSTYVSKSDRPNEESLGLRNMFISNLHALRYISKKKTMTT